MILANYFSPLLSFTSTEDNKLAVYNTYSKVTCQKYFSIISESSQTHNVLATGLPLTVKVTSTFLTRKWISQDSWAISWSLTKKWLAAPLLWRREVGWSGFCHCRCLGTRKPFFIAEECPLKTRSSSLAHALLLPSHIGWTAWPGHSDTSLWAREKRQLSTPSFHLLERRPSSNTPSIINFDNKTSGKGILNSSWATPLWTYLTRQHDTHSSMERVHGVGILFIHSFHTYWTPTVCQALVELEVPLWARQSRILALMDKGNFPHF